MAGAPEEHDFLEDAEVGQAERDLLARADRGQGVVRRPPAGPAASMQLGEADPDATFPEERAADSTDFSQEMPGDVRRDDESAHTAAPARRVRAPDPEYDEDPPSRATGGVPWVYVGAAIIVIAAAVAAGVLFWPQLKLSLHATASSIQVPRLRQSYLAHPSAAVAPPTAAPIANVVPSAAPIGMPSLPHAGASGIGVTGMTATPAQGAKTPSATVSPLGAMGNSSVSTVAPVSTPTAVTTPPLAPTLPQELQTSPAPSSSPVTPPDTVSTTGSLATTPQGVSLPAKATGAAPAISTESPVVRALAHEVKRLWRVVAGMQKSITGLEHMMSQMALSQDHQAKTIRYQAAEIRVLQERLNRFMKKMEHSSVLKKKPVPQKAKGPKPLPAGVRLIGIIGHTAWIRVPSGSIVHAFPGMSIPGVGTVSAIVMNPPHVLLRNGQQIESRWSTPPR